MLRASWIVFYSEMEYLFIDLLHIFVDVLTLKVREFWRCLKNTGIVFQLPRNVMMDNIDINTIF